MIEITEEEIEAIIRSLKAGDYQFRKPKTIEKLIANHRASQWRSVDELPDNQQRVLVEIASLDDECSYAIAWREKDSDGEYWCFGNPCLSWDYDFNLGMPEVIRWRPIDQ